MTDHKQIYNQHADQYERLVAREDYEGNILRALEQLAPLAGRKVVELGAGTGRLTCMLAPLVKTICAFDLSAHMLGVAAAKLTKTRASWQVVVADHRSLPLGDAMADVVISGWSICYLVVWGDDHWRDEVGKALAEMKRVLRPGGKLIILETLGTGNTEPHRLDNLEGYFKMLESGGFQSRWIRTDYKFESKAEAEELVGFFFGADMCQRVVGNDDDVLLPECTGLWWQGWLADKIHHGGTEGTEKA